MVRHYFIKKFYDKYIVFVIFFIYLSYCCGNNQLLIVILWIKSTLERRTVMVFPVFFPFGRIVQDISAKAF
jgi:hypothetical protein